MRNLRSLSPLVEVFLCLTLCLVGSGLASPQISTTNVLLPPSPNLEHRVQLTKGCWSVKDYAYDDGSDDDLIEVFPTDPLTRDSGGIECTVFQPEDESCHRDFKIRVRQAKRRGFRSLVFTKSDPEDARPVEMRVDVRVADISKLEILTTTKRVEVGEKEVLQVIGRDRDDNVFTTLSGLALQWRIESGRQFIELQSLSEANILNREESAALDATKQSALGLSTGRATVAVQLDKLEAKVELIVSRALTICPGSSVSLLQGSTFEPLFCLKTLGCFSSGKQFRAKFPTSGDEYDWLQALSHTYEKPGIFSIVVEDRKEKTNRGSADLIVGELDSITHHIALNASRGETLDVTEGECGYYKSRGMEWPPLSKQLPTMSAFKHHQAKYYLVKGRSYVFMGLAKVKEGGYSPPHLHEKVSFKLDSESSFKQEQFLHTMLVTPQATGQFPAEGRFRNALEKFTVIVFEPVVTQPKDLILMTPNCKSEIIVSGGSGSFRSRYRTSLSTGVGSSSYVSVQNWTRISTKAADVSNPSEEGRLVIWDEMDSGNRVDLQFFMRRIDRLKMKKKHYYVMEGSSLRVDVLATDEESRLFTCCSDIRGDWEELPIMGEESLLHLEDDASFTSSLTSAACASASFTAARVGTTRVRFYSTSGTVVSSHVTVFPRLRLDPDVAVLTSGSSTRVRVLGGPFPSEVSLETTNEGRVKLSQDRQYLDVNCAKDLPAGTGESQTTTIKMQSVEDQELFVEATFTLFCIVPSHCRVDLGSVETGELVPQAFIGPNAQVRAVVSVFGKNEQNITVPSWKEIYMEVNGRSRGGDLTIPTDKEERMEVKAMIPDLKFECIRGFTVRKPFVVLPEPPLTSDSLEMALNEETVTWIWKGCDARFHIVHGSGSFNVVTSDSSVEAGFVGATQREAVVRAAPMNRADGMRSSSAAKSHLFSRVTFVDENFFPFTRTSRLVMFQPVQKLNVKQSPEYVAQNANVEFVLDPVGIDTVSSSLISFDWSEYKAEHASMEWEPRDMFELRSRPDAKTFKLHALRTGNATIRYKLCSTCDLSKCVVGEREIQVEKYLSAIIFPGSQYDLANCDLGGPLLTNCEVRTTSFNGVLTVSENGTVVAGCREGHAVVRCVQDNQVTTTQEPQLSYFHVAVKFPSKIEWFPSGNALSSHWAVIPSAAANDSAYYQVHAALASGESTCFVEYKGKRTDTWEFGVASEGRRTQWHTVTSSKSLASVAIQPNHPGLWKVSVKVAFGGMNETCDALTTKNILRAERRFMAHSVPTLLTPTRVLLPPGSLYEIRTAPSVSSSGGFFGCFLQSGCGACEDFALVQEGGGCTLRVSNAPKTMHGVCAVTIGSVPQGTDSQFGSFDSFPYHVILVETKPISTFSLKVESNHRLQVNLHDDSTRTFTSGWIDDSPLATRTIRFFPSRTVTVDSEFLRNNQANCSSGQVLQSFKVLTTSKKATGTLVAALYENDVLVAKALVDKIERFCSRSFFGFFCLDNTEFILLSSVASGLLVAFLQGYWNTDVYVVVIIIVLYFVVF